MSDLAVVPLTVVITGATGGLGTALTRRFAAAGMRLLVTGRPESTTALAALADSVSTVGGQVVSVPADLRLERDADAMVAACLKAHGRLDVLIHSAGGTLPMLTGDDSAHKPLWKHTSDEWEFVVASNLTTTFNCMRSAAPPMIEQRSGHIVVISSGAALRPVSMLASYAAAKAGTLGLMRAAAMELGAYGVQVNAINPGMTIHERSPDRYRSGEPTVEAYRRELLVGRLSEPTDFAEFTFNLVQMRAVSGQVFNIDSRFLG